MLGKISFQRITNDFPFHSLILCNLFLNLLNLSLIEITTQITYTLLDFTPIQQYAVTSLFNSLFRPESKQTIKI